MGFTDAVKTCLSKYVVFQGRARRAEYWYFELFALLLGIVAGIVGGVTGIQEGGINLLSAILTLALILPGLAVSVRRLHDLDKSGWWILLAFIPFVGAVILLIWFCMKGTAGENRFGSDPLGHAAEAFA